ncbi:SDR family oxidoreductase [Paraburkholderia oxyphila]|uniref:SDR family oxidoreductase n=1 Tax=Paraburkholderia oxyphila TaxID=614212 RepID=UPI0009FE8D2F|nr:SDR family oxidoreductase [Paraburkholderia oxyphila]
MNTRFGPPNTDSGIPPKPFDFKRNGCSPSSGNPVRLQPKSVFGFAEIRTPSIDCEYIARVPVRRLGLSEDIANAVRFLVSADASGITGTVIDVKGGTFCD